MKTFYLKAGTKTALISALNAHGFGFASTPNAFEIKTNGVMTAVYLGKIVDTVDDEGNVLTYKDGWHADVLAPIDTTFSVDVIEPATPNHKFA
jgi:hypothetical protein